MVITTIPYFLGFANEGESWRYSGFVFGVEDGNSYIAKMLRGSEGEWLFRTPYTAEEQGGVLAFLSYLSIGKLAADPGRHEQLVVLFHVYRIAAGMLVILASYNFIALFVKNERLRFIGLIISSFGGGLGYFLLIAGNVWWLGNLPLEFYSPESFGFLTLFGLPHLGMAKALLLWGMVNYLNMDRAKGGKIAGVLWFFMGIFQPLTIVQVFILIGGHLLYIYGYHALKKLTHNENQWGDLRWWTFRALWAGIIPLPMVFYTYIVFSTDPVVEKWTTQNIIHSPHPLHYLVAYGLVLPFAVLGLFILLRSDGPEKWLLPVWFFLFPVLVYAPIDLQRRLAEGFWLVLLVLSLVFLDRSQPRVRKLGLYVFLFTLPSTVILLAGSISAVSSPAVPLFRPADEVTAFQYLAKNTPGGGVVLSSYETGNALPAWAPVYVLVGHGPESIDKSTLLPEVQKFYQEDTEDINRLNFLRENQVDFVFWGPMEKNLGDWNPGKADYLEQVYDHMGYKIYSVIE